MLDVVRIHHVPRNELRGAKVTEIYLTSFGIDLNIRLIVQALDSAAWLKRPGLPRKRQRLLERLLVRCLIGRLEHRLPPPYLLLRTLLVLALS